MNFLKTRRHHNNIGYRQIRNGKSSVLIDRLDKELVMSEREIQRNILDYLQILENQGKCYCFRAGSGAIKTDQGRFFKTGKAGCPDIICAFSGKFIGLEVKKESGRQSPIQCETEEKIRRAGGEYHLVRSLDEVAEIIK